jgi:hypothetical protein
MGNLFSSSTEPEQASPAPVFDTPETPAPATTGGKKSRRKTRRGGKKSKGKGRK